MRKVLGFILQTVNVGLVFNADRTSKVPAEWRIDVSVDASHYIPWCQSGMVVTLSPVAAEPTDLVPHFLPIDWTSSGQEYIKLAPAESETVGVVQAARGGLRYKHSWDDVCGVAEPQQMMVRVDNTQAIAFAERGWSPSMMHLPRVYGVNVLWVTERLREGLMYIVKEPTKVMLADPLTKLMNPQVYHDRGILTRFAWEAEKPEAKIHAVLRNILFWTNLGPPSS